MVLMLPATSWVPMSEAWPMLPGGTRIHEFEAIVQHQQWRARPRWRHRPPSYCPYRPDRRAHTWHRYFRRDINRKRWILGGLGGMTQTERVWE